MKQFRAWKNQCLSNKIFDVVNLFVLICTLIICFYPLYYILILSFSDQVVGTYLWPSNFNVSGYKLILERTEIWIGYGNTIIYTVLQVLASLAVILPFAYALSRRDLIGRNLMTGFIMLTMFVSGGLVPGYLNMYNLGLLNTRACIIIAGLVSTYNIIVARTFFASTVSGELFDAAKMDGCGNGRFFFTIVMPLSKPIAAVMALYVGVAQWNSYFTEMIYLRDDSKYPLSLYLRRLLNEVNAITKMMEEAGIEIPNAAERLQAATVMQYSIIIVSTVPMLIVYPFIQKYFAKGVMIGSVKG